MRYALKFAYDGSQFEGYARQPDFFTTEGEIIRAMKKQKIIESAKASRFASSSRTDRGVSAAGNVLAVNTDFRGDAILNSLNSALEGIVFHGIAGVDDDFNPRHAKNRSYRYVILKSQCPDIGKMQEAANIFLGVHDFRHFSKKDTGDENTVLTMDSIDFLEQGQFIMVDIKARRFLWQLVRRLVAFILAMADGKISQDKVREMLDGSAKILASPKPMPPENLILMDVKFKFEFEELAGEGHSFQTLQNKAILRAGVMGQIVERLVQ